jgi:hypothetical protein
LLRSAKRWGGLVAFTDFAAGAGVVGGITGHFTGIFTGGATGVRRALASRGCDLSFYVMLTLIRKFLEVVKRGDSGQ